MLIRIFITTLYLYKYCLKYGLSIIFDFHYKVVTRVCGRQQTQSRQFRLVYGSKTTSIIHIDAVCIGLQRE